MEDMMKTLAAAKTIETKANISSKMFVENVRPYDGGHFQIVNGMSPNGMPVKSFVDGTKGDQNETQGVLVNPTSPKDGDSIGNADLFIFLSRSEYEKLKETGAAQKPKQQQRAANDDAPF